MAQTAIRKDNPTQRNVHHDAILTNISVAYMQNQTQFGADRIFPVVPVQKQSDKYFYYPKAAWFRDEAQKRGPAQESAGGGYNLSDDSYYADVWAFHKDLDDQTMANADEPLNLAEDATEFVTQRLLLRREMEFVNNFFTTGVWGEDLIGDTDFDQFDDYTASDPISTVDDSKDVIKLATGIEPNTLAITNRVWRHLKDHPDIIERIKYTQEAIVPPELVARLFGVDRLVVLDGVYNKAPEQDDETSDDAWDSDWIHGKDMLLCYTTDNPSLMQATAGYTFAWTGYGGQNAYGTTINRFRMENIKADRVEGEMAFDMKVVAPDLGVFFEDVVSE